MNERNNPGKENTDSSPCLFTYGSNSWPRFPSTRHFSFPSTSPPSPPHASLFIWQPFQKREGREIQHTPSCTRTCTHTHKVSSWQPS